MKRIGILTFHRASNYGAILQAYALQKTLIELGFEAPIIDYRTPRVEFDHQPRYAIRKAGVIRGIKAVHGKLRKTSLFRTFREQRLLTSDAVEGKQLCSLNTEYDAFLVGSDQVWSDAYAGVDPHLFLDFANYGQKYSYACSFGLESPTQRMEEACDKYLPSFSGISLREASGRNFVEQRLGIPSRVDIDPTLLLGPESWSDLSEAPEQEGYILIYTVPGPRRLVEAARNIGRQLGKQIIYLNNSYTSNRDLNHARFVTPEQFIGLFCNADAVFTNSFHGTAFSIIFRKPLYVELQTSRGFNNRSAELLQLCGLESRVLNDTVPVNLNPRIDWESCHTLIDEARVSSLAYLSTVG